MDTLVDQAVKRFDTEPIDIYTHPTYLPQNMRASAADLWNKTRRSKLIDALLRNKVAVEINTLNHLPNQPFILEAKDAGCKFAFGTANTTAYDLTRCEYGLQMVESCKLDWHDFFAPGSWWPKAVERVWPSASS